MTKRIQSMTGVGSAEGQVGPDRYRIELKTLNHRFVDIKLRLPRELSAFEMPLRALASSLIKRGSLEVKVERAHGSGGIEAAHPPEINLTLAAHYYEALISLQKTLGLTDTIHTVQIATMPDVLSRASHESIDESLGPNLEVILKSAFESLIKMREHEGANLSRVLIQSLDEISETLTGLRKQREKLIAAAKKKVTEKIEALFELYPIENGSIRSILESRIAQELAIIADRTDVEEELARISGHIDHFKTTLEEGGQVGKKLDFLLQELNREVNTFSNKSADLQMSFDAVQLRVRIEQIREQVMNLE